DSGCVIVGGGALLYGIGEAISDFLGIPARVSEDPLTAVARGTGVFLEKLDIFSRVLSSDDEG
ncbi:MAG TPA: rod shape-determining protein, partial [Planctomycetes bacterium]|nr:rod shape-determining protein [Planctomycetota bacterium]